MDGNLATAPSNAVAEKHKISVSFFKKGITVAILSGIFYGLYTVFMTKGMSEGVWTDWYGPNEAGLSAFAITFVLGALGSAVNDTVSGVWTLINVSIKGKLGDFFRTVKTKPGAMMIICALIGGPIASTAYVVSLQLAGSMIIPITALCPAIGAILGRIVFKQELNGRMLVGVFVCVGASILIGSASFGEAASDGAFLGFCIAFVAALGWGIEGCVAGYGTSLIDYQIGITIRQCTSGLSNLIIMVPLMCLISGNIGLAPQVIGAAFSSGSAMIFFLISGLCAVFAFGFWYKGTSMCGAPLGMACNGMYSFWGPFFCWIILGLIFNMDGWGLLPRQWVGAVVMAVGILLITMNPLDLFRKKEEI